VSIAVSRPCYLPYLDISTANKLGYSDIRFRKRFQTKEGDASMSKKKKRKPKKTKEKIERYGDWRNNEGYADPVVGQVLHNIARSERKQKSNSRR